MIFKSLEVSLVIYTRLGMYIALQLLNEQWPDAYSFYQVCNWSFTNTVNHITMTSQSGIILDIRTANERRHYIVPYLSLAGRIHKMIPGDERRVFNHW